MVLSCLSLEWRHAHLYRGLSSQRSHANDRASRLLLLLPTLLPMSLLPMLLLLSSTGNKGCDVHKSRTFEPTWRLALLPAALVSLEDGLAPFGGAVLVLVAGVALAVACFLGRPRRLGFGASAGVLFAGVVLAVACFLGRRRRLGFGASAGVLVLVLVLGCVLRPRRLGFGASAGVLVLVLVGVLVLALVLLERPGCGIGSELFLVLLLIVRTRGLADLGCAIGPSVRSEEQSFSSCIPVDPPPRVSSLGTEVSSSLYSEEEEDDDDEDDDDDDLISITGREDPPCRPEVSWVPESVFADETTASASSWGAATIAGGEGTFRSSLALVSLVAETGFCGVPGFA